MTERVVSRTTSSEPWGPREWTLVGLVLLLVGAFVGAAIGGEKDGALAALICATPGSVMFTVGVVAKAVQVGIKSARD